MPTKDVRTILTMLAERFPAAFVFDRHLPHRPLKIGIYNDVKARCPELKATECGLGLRWYCSRLLYRQSLVAGAGRIDLDGNPTGEVTAEEEAKAKADIAEIEAKREAKRAAAPTEIQARREQGRAVKAPSPTTKALKPTTPPEAAPSPAAPTKAPPTPTPPAPRRDQLITPGSKKLGLAGLKEAARARRASPS